MTSILAVIVLYKIDPRDSASVVTLSRELNVHRSPLVRSKVLLVNNGPEVEPAPHLFSAQEERKFPDNLGLANAYNIALDMAQREGYEWLLLLDQDTHLPQGYLERLLTAVESVGSDQSIAGVLPRVMSGDKVLSPYFLKGGALPQWFPIGYSGVPDRNVFAINSGALMRAGALLQAGGYDPRFWLDAADHVMFRSLHSFGKRMYVAGEVVLSHDLSVLGERGSIPRERYRNMLAAESAFWDLSMGRGGRVARSATVAIRAARQLLRRDFSLASLSIRHVLFRLLTGRKQRVQIWLRRYPVRGGSFCLQQPVSPRISVCMASYNSERYIKQQLDSVLTQLGPDDELIVVDDASRDGTLGVVAGLGDARIRVVQHAANQGVVATFEHALRCATGGILFFCDGDDIWAGHKVRSVLDAFNRDPAATVVCTGMSLIDGEDKPLDRDEYTNRAFTASLLQNLVSNRFQGSAMAIRSSLLRHVLPFPKGRSFLHDAWVGACNALIGGKVIYLAEPLLFYRRHGSNVSQPLSWMERIRKRVQIVLALAAYWSKRRLSGEPAYLNPGSHPSPRLEKLETDKCGTKV